jgi:hypothetical protein
MLSSGQVVSRPSNSTTYSAQSGAIAAQQASVPSAPTVSNGSNTYYNKLDIIIATGGNASDALYAIAISTDNFVTTNYVQADGSVGATPLFQTYVQWGSSTGTTATGLLPSTAYKMKVAAMQGMFTQSSYGPAASASTTSPSISFAVSTNTVTLSNLLPGSVVTSAPITTSLTTNASFGANVYVTSLHSGLQSISTSRTIPSLTGDLSSLSRGYGLQVGSLTQSAGGPFVGVAPFNGSSNNTGIVTTSLQPIFSSSSAISSGSGNVYIKAKVAASDAAATDYSDTLTYLTAARY